MVAGVRLINCAFSNSEKSLKKRVAIFRNFCGFVPSSFSVRNWLNCLPIPFLSKMFICHEKKYFKHFFVSNAIHTFFFRWAPEKNGDRHSENCQRLFRWQFRYQTIVQLLAARPLGALVVYDSALIKKVPWLAACAAANNTTERIQLSFARTYVLTLIYVAKVSFETFTINLYRNL